MPSDSVVGFLDSAKANRVLGPEQVEQLIHQPDIPQSNLTALCDYLMTRGVLTRFQATSIRDSRGQDLNFAGYPVIDEIGPCPGGVAYKALHPSLRTTLVLRRLKLEWLSPNDTLPEYLNRAKSFGMLSHPNIVPLLDVGVYQEEIYLAIDQPLDAANLESLIGEVGGAMPGFLAAEYGRVIASALRMVHERGGVHGDLRPENLLVGPLSVKKTPEGKEKRRPAPNATVRIMEVGLVPLRPPATQYHPDNRAIKYLPPERLDSGTLGTRGDIYALGACLYFLLTGRPPFEGADANELLSRVRSAEPTPLAALRPDLPPELVRFVASMLVKQPELRPETAADVMTALTPFCRSATPSLQSVPLASPASTDGTTAPVAIVSGTDVPTENDVQTGFDNDAWGAGLEGLTATSTSARASPRKPREISGKERVRARLLLILGALLHIGGVSLLAAWWFGAFDSAQPAPESAPTKNESPVVPKKNKKQNRAT